MGMVRLMGEGDFSRLRDMELAGTSQHGWVRGRVG